MVSIHAPTWAKAGFTPTFEQNEAFGARQEGEGFLLMWKKIDRQRYLVSISIPGLPDDFLQHQPVLRRWDHVADREGDGALLVKENDKDDGWLELERGIRIRFLRGGAYQTGTTG